ncbi:hypothetical protein TWF481_009800 [Arthrobotrys musiformis]|uniref:Uncharacterized protein n=1 Tax=Arthrobotrys musiformis TaxID=47236 RepID=A0AAV9W4W5_9PEZI
MARCKILSPVMLVIHLLLILVLSDLTLSLPAGGSIDNGSHNQGAPRKPKDPSKHFKDLLKKTSSPRKPPRDVITTILVDVTTTVPEPSVVVPGPIETEPFDDPSTPIRTTVPAPVDPPAALPVDQRDVRSAFKERAIEVLANCKKRGIDIYGDIPGDAERVPANDPSVPLKRHDGMVFENMTFVHTFSADSDASLWATAQVLVGQFPELVNGTKTYQEALQKRAKETIKADPGVEVTVHRAAGAISGFDGDRIGIGMWEGGQRDWTTNPQPCQGKGWWIDPVRHSITYLANIPTWSVGVSFRALGGYDRERLDFRTHSAGSQSDCGERIYSAGEHTPASCWRHGKVAARCFILLQNPAFKAPSEECKNGVCKPRK